MCSIPGVLLNSQDVLRKEIQARLFECRQPKDSIVFVGPDDDVRSVIMSGTKGIARVLDVIDGQDKVGVVVGKILNEAVKAKENSLQIADINYNVKAIEAQLSVAHPGVPDPECVLCFGPACISVGLIPWQLNHSEIIELDSHHNILPSQFLQALERYAKIEKRFGK
ncbi:dehydrodolichyl diphosphate synthase complex subunit nus1-like [Galendromus occidentalis]|uniref:ditrans,polycis-polyprenyl diphosphate synthase [(2E,6E)-farnesyldiphosphate specific] n=1 Tax=Galendromus occidentalis TaxID=34638 RepID=A0AAJ6QTC9_9ACAR|nr:dehydrodolichyl diphosphate synthase complex subunit nus1-like [Galendromus occidentalis]